MYVSMKGMLRRANEGNYAVMAINCFNIETARAVISAAQSLRAPIIVNIVQEHMVKHCDSDLIAPVIKKLAEQASVEVALNFDHGEELGLLKKALADGYSSVMVDASARQARFASFSRKTGTPKALLSSLSIAILCHPGRLGGVSTVPDIRSKGPGQEIPTPCVCT